MPNKLGARSLCLMLALSSAGLVAGCASRGPRDVGSATARSGVVARSGDTSTMEPAASPVSGRKPKTFAAVDSRAIALGSDRVFFGNTADDALVSLPKGQANETPAVVASHAPMLGALSFDARTSTLAWVPSPGNLVLRVNPEGGKVVTIRDRGIFANVVASEGDVFFTEAHGSGGVLTRVTGTTAARLAAFEGAPRGLFVDANSAYVATSSRLIAAARKRGEVVELARGRSFASPRADDTGVYAVAVNDTSRERDIVRVQEAGADLETLVRDVRDAPIAVTAHTLYWFDGKRPALLSMRLTESAAQAAPIVVAEDPLFAHVEALVVDEARAYAAVGEDGYRQIVAIDLR